MRAEVSFVDEAVGEVDDAVLWYQERRDGLGLAFLAALDGAVESIKRWPRAGALVDDVAEDLEVRRVPVPRFPYFVAYFVGDEGIVVLAVAHERRRPRYWGRRAEA